MKILGHKVNYSSYIGINLIACRELYLEKNTKIKSFNFIKIDALKLDKYAFINRFNVIKGPFTISLSHKAGISNSNKIRRAYSPVTTGKSNLTLGENSFIVSHHFLDLTQSISIGENSIIAGLNTYLWTHGYYHAEQGPNRMRIDGTITIGDNVYIGSGCIFNPGVSVGNAIHLGAGSVISKDLDKPGMYVGQALRYVQNSFDSIKEKLVKIDDDMLVEDVYIKS